MFETASASARPATTTSTPTATVGEDTATAQLIPSRRPLPPPTPPPHAPPSSESKTVGIVVGLLVLLVLVLIGTVLYLSRKSAGNGNPLRQDNAVQHQPHVVAAAAAVDGATSADAQPEFIAVALQKNPLYRPHTGLPANVALQNNPLYQRHTGSPANVALQNNPLYQPHNVHGGGGDAAAATAVIYAIPMEASDGGGAAAAAAAAAADGSRSNSQPAPDTVFYDANADTYSTTHNTGVYASPTSITGQGAAIAAIQQHRSRSDSFC